MDNRNILVLVFSNLRHDARVRRQVNALVKEAKVTVACFDAEDDGTFEIIRLPQSQISLITKGLTAILLLLRVYHKAYWMLHPYRMLLQTLQHRTFHLIVANDVETLPLAFALPGNPNVFFDAHEYAPRHFEDKRMWRIFFKGFNTSLCHKYIPRCVGMTTVGKGLAQEYEKHFGVRPEVIANANHYHDVQPSPVLENKIRLVHHGIANPSRKLELMIELMDKLDGRFTLDLILMVPGNASSKTRQYIDELKKKAAHNPSITFHPPVKGNEVVPTIHAYDIGVFLLPPVNFNYANTLPNKFFDFIQARLGIAIGPTPEMAEIVNQYGNGVVSGDFTAEQLAVKLNALTKTDVERFKVNSGVAAKFFNAEKNNETLRALINKAMA